MGHPDYHIQTLAAYEDRQAALVEEAERIEAMYAANLQELTANFGPVDFSDMVAEVIEPLNLLTMADADIGAHVRKVLLQYIDARVGK